MAYEAFLQWLNRPTSRSPHLTRKSIEICIAKQFIFAFFSRKDSGVLFCLLSSTKRPLTRFRLLIEHPAPPHHHYHPQKGLFDSLVPPLVHLTRTQSFSWRYLLRSIHLQIYSECHIKSRLDSITLCAPVPVELTTAEENLFLIQISPSKTSRQKGWKKHKINHLFGRS